VTPNPRQQITIASVAFGFGLLLLGITPRVPKLERIDRVLIGWLLDRTGADSARMIGSGDHDDPRRVRGAPSRVPASDIPAPRFLAITDDPEGWFESHPPGPIDLAFVLEKLHTLGHRQISAAALLAWENPDPIAAGAMEHELGRFRPAIIGAPLVRGLSDEPMPAAFERLSVPLDRIAGDTGVLPIVNRVAVPGVRFGGDSTLAAFTRLESEAAPPFSGTTSAVPVPLLARWGDRVVVALPLAHQMARFDVSIDQLTITPGVDIRVGESGPIIPIDPQGQVQVRPGTAENAAVIPAEELTRRSREKVPEALHPTTMPLVLRDDRSDAPAATREYSAHLAEIMVALDRAPRAGQPQVIKRPHTVIEFLLIGLLAGLAGGILHLPRKLRNPGFAVLAVGSILVSLLLLSSFRTTPPPLAMLGGALTGWLIALFLPRRHPAPQPEAEPETKEPDTAPPSKTAPPPRKSARKKPRGKSRKSRRKRP
jgi:hypothetical protein